MCGWVWVGASHADKVACSLYLASNTAGVDLAFPRGPPEGAVGGGTGVRCRADAGAILPLPALAKSI